MKNKENTMHNRLPLAIPLLSAMVLAGAAALAAGEPTRPSSADLTHEITSP